VDQPEPVGQYLLILPTVFNRYGTDRLTQWKEFRNSLEVSNTPFNDVAKFWSHAPFVSPYLNPQTPTEWPDPWHLVLDSRLDDLAIALGMLYTIKLTRRFMDSKCEIHTSMSAKEKKYILVVDSHYVLNLQYGDVVDFDNISKDETSLIWAKH
jgi:hypothetical protein